MSNLLKIGAAGTQNSPVHGNFDPIFENDVGVTKLLVFLQLVQRLHGLKAHGPLAIHRALPRTWFLSFHFTTVSQFVFDSRLSSLQELNLFTDNFETV